MVAKAPTSRIFKSTFMTVLYFETEMFAHAQQGKPRACSDHARGRTYVDVDVDVRTWPAVEFILGSLFTAL